MSNFSSTYPSVSPTYQIDFANGGRIPPNATFSRASTANVFDGSKHLSSENLLTDSNGFPAYATNNVVTPSASGTFIDGTDAFVVTETTANGYHFINSTSGQISSGTSYTATVFVKAGTASSIQMLYNANTFPTTVYANYDLATPTNAPVTGADATATSTALSDGWVKITLTGTATSSGSYPLLYLVFNNDDINSARLPTYTPSSAKNYYVWEANVSTTGEKVLNQTSGSIHREYASSLVSKANNAARFETATDGQSAGIRIEGQSTNLLTNSTDFSGSWQIVNATKSLEAIAPNGALNAIAFREGTNSNEKRLLRYYGAGGGNVTISVYAKLMGNTRRLVIREANASGQSAIFDISTGTKVSGNGSIDSVGNGWYRCQLNLSSTNTTQAAGFYIIPADGTSYTASAFTGDGYSGLLLAMPQAEDQSFASSYIDTGTGGSTATRAADSMSAATADIGYTGGPVTIVTEIDGVYGSYPRAFALSDGTSSNVIEVHGDSASSTPSTGWYAYSAVDGVIYVVNANIPSSNGATKLAISYDTNDVAYSADGNTPGSDTAATFPGGLTTLSIGVQANGTSNQLNGHVKRIALFGEALSDQNLISLTS